MRATLNVPTFFSCTNDPDYIVWKNSGSELGFTRFRKRAHGMLRGDQGAATYIAQGDEDDYEPSLRYLTLLREGARAHGLPEHYIRFLERLSPRDSMHGDNKSATT